MFYIQKKVNISQSYDAATANAVLEFCFHNHDNQRLIRNIGVQPIVNHRNKLYHLETIYNFYI